MPQPPLPPCMIEELAASLVEEARFADERRLLVLAGDRWRGLEAVEKALAAAAIDREAAVLISQREDLGLDAVPPEEAGDLLGTTRSAVIFDAHGGLSPNALGRVVGTVTGGGLFVLLTPSLDDWSVSRDSFDESLAVPPFGVNEVTGHFRTRFVETLRSHRGIAIVDVDSKTVERDGLTDPAPRVERQPGGHPQEYSFPIEAYEACLTDDQVGALVVFEVLREADHAVVVEADRGRGKSSVAGLAAGSLAAGGEDVVVTAPEYRSAREVFVRADDLLRTLGEHAGAEGEEPRRIETAAGGELRFERPVAAVEESPDVLLVDEAAALPVALLASFLELGRVAFTTTIHGYEGAGRGFSVRFRDHLEASELAVDEVSLVEPIRYAAGDPVEVWSFRALLLDARPPPAEVIEEARPETVKTTRLEPVDLLADEQRLREAFGLLVLAHYRTEPDDLARLLDAPNVEVHALLYDGHVASVAVLAREGGLDPQLRSHMYEGGRVRGNMLPDVLTSQLCDESAGKLRGSRVMRIATHAAVRSRGLGSALLEDVRETIADEVDWLGVGYGATSDLVQFWDANGFSTIHLSTTRNETSGEHSALMLSPTSDPGRALLDRHGSWFAERVLAMLPDSLSSLEPDVVAAAFRATDVKIDLSLTEAQWRHVASMAYGPGLLDVDPAPFRRLAAKHLIDPAETDLLSSREEHLLVLRVLQTRRWGETADELDFHSRGECMRALGRAYQPLVDAYGTEEAHAERERFSDR